MAFVTGGMILLAKDLCLIADIPVSLKIAGFWLAAVTAQTISERESSFFDSLGNTTYCGRYKQMCSSQCKYSADFLL